MLADETVPVRALRQKGAWDRGKWNQAHMVAMY